METLFSRARGDRVEGRDSRGLPERGGGLQERPTFLQSL